MKKLYKFSRIEIPLTYLLGELLVLRFQLQENNWDIPILVIYSCGGFNTPTLCVVTKGIKADCNHLIEHTMRNIEHCTPMLCVGVVDFRKHCALLKKYRQKL